MPTPATAAMAAKNKCLADSNKTRAENKATNRRLHPGQYPPVVRMRTRDRVSSLPRWRGPTSSRCAHPSGEKELPPMPRSRIEIYWRAPETAPDGVIAQVLVTDIAGPIIFYRIRASSLKTDGSMLSHASHWLCA